MDRINQYRQYRWIKQKALINCSKQMKEIDSINWHRQIKQIREINGMDWYRLIKQNSIDRLARVNRLAQMDLTKQFRQTSKGKQTD